MIIFQDDSFVTLLDYARIAAEALAKLEHPAAEGKTISEHAGEIHDLLIRWYCREDFEWISTDGIVLIKVLGAGGKVSHLELAVSLP